MRTRDINDEFTLTDRSVLRLMVSLAVQWESALADANTPPDDQPQHEDQRKTIRRCQRNIRAFRALETKLLKQGHLGHWQFVMPKKGRR